MWSNYRKSRDWIGGLRMEQFSHVDSTGKLRMVNVGRKKPTRRQALAGCAVITVADLSSLAPKANGMEALHAARLAGINGAKQTANLIPLCHPLNLDNIHVELEPKAGRIEILATVGATHRTGVEMEALTACALAALSLLNALLRTDPDAKIDDLVLLRKTGGKSGDWGRLVEDSRT
jgi:cyclic pyranopterin monophosphate synthase